MIVSSFPTRSLRAPEPCSLRPPSPCAYRSRACVCRGDAPAVGRSHRARRPWPRRASNGGHDELLALGQLSKANGVKRRPLRLCRTPRSTVGQVRGCAAQPTRHLGTTGALAPQRSAGLHSSHPSARRSTFAFAQKKDDLNPSAPCRAAPAFTLATCVSATACRARCAHRPGCTTQRLTVSPPDAEGSTLCCGALRGVSFGRACPHTHNALCAASSAACSQGGTRGAARGAASTANGWRASHEAHRRCRPAARRVFHRCAETRPSHTHPILPCGRSVRTELLRPPRACTPSGGRCCTSFNAQLWETKPRLIVWRPACLAQPCAWLSWRSYRGVPC